jgi:hypothetical protein
METEIEFCGLEKRRYVDEPLNDADSANGLSPS